MKGQITIICTEEKNGDRLRTETSIEGQMEMSSLTDRYRLMLSMAAALSFEPDDWLKLATYRMMAEIGALPDDKRTGGTMMVNLGAIEKARRERNGGGEG